VSIDGFRISWDVVVLGFVTGMLYGILAVGLVLVYRTSRIINFAHGEIGAFGAALLGVAVAKWHVPYWFAFVLALAVAAGIGAASEKFVVRRLRNAPLVLTIIATLVLGQLISLMSSEVDGSVGSGISFPQPAGFPRFNVGALLMTPAYSAMLILTPLIVVALVVFLRRGRLGLALRASSSNPDAARMAGILADRMSGLAWAIAGAVAAVTAILVLPTRGFSGGDFLGPDLLLRGLACAVVAQMVSLPIALAAGIGLGVVEQLLLANYPSGGQVEVLLFAIILVALLVQRSRSGRSEDKGTWSAVQSFKPLPRRFRQVATIRNLGWIVAAIAIPVGLIVPELTTNANATTFSLIAAFSIVGISVGLVTGLGGQLSLGQFAIAGVGATASYVATREGAPFVVGLVCAGLLAGVTSLLLGIPALRIRGLMLAVTTLGFALAAESWLFQQSWMLGPGVSARRPAIGHYAFDTGKRYYLVAFAVLLVVCWLARNVWNSGIGRRIRAVRDNEDAARAFTVGATATKLQVFVLGGVVAGLGGAVYGALLAQQAASAYPIDSSINAATVAAIGGLGLLAGPILGALYLIGLPQFLSLDTVGAAATTVGVLVLLLWRPGGLAQVLSGPRDRIVDALARRAGLDPEAERRALPDTGDAAVGLDLPAAPVRRIPPGAPLLEASGLIRRFGGIRAVDGVTLEVRAGETLGLIGPNGAGKTTLFELLGGFTEPDEGTIRFEGRDITSLRAEQRARLGLIRSFQDAALFPTMTVHEVVMLSLERADPTRFAAALVGATTADRRKAQRAESLLASFGLLRYQDVTISALSTGTRRITELACLVALEPVLLLLDEPTSGIAQRETEALGIVLRQIKVELDLTMVIIEHDIPLVMGISDRVVAMESGAVLTVGTPAEVQADPRVIESYLGGDIRAIERSGAR
jgi:ABC-type branched-subunit amino acid transport system ATPase component/ABC-type branched-subunit amino acid transport system permease subunit